MIMKKIRGFKLGRKLVKVLNWIIRPRRRRNLRNSFLGNCSPLTRLCSFAAFLRRGTKGLCDSESDPGYIQLGGKEAKRVGVPKGHLAVYIGESEGNTRRVVVPLIYFNHPLFSELLKDAERVYGLNQSGGITLPCGISEFEKVKMRIADWDHCRRKQHRRYL
ncbi:vacuolar-processing enzyme-like [Hibiscus syriacus]|uniref:Vacuolar-processing enzyme-like n=1 Tax=Hibiscus syriacus TaxID=106335 RepID=A0A6A2YWK9_HIBSY|nr:auxin-responsive protein SAUR36-like [Hibiscus syriacus]KAE8683793.1 vacuolar-processing enzyme-like [Hibiscus syriacus]